MSNESSNTLNGSSISIASQQSSIVSIVQWYTLFSFTTYKSAGVPYPAPDVLTWTTVSRLPSKCIKTQSQVPILPANPSLLKAKDVEIDKLKVSLIKNYIKDLDSLTDNDINFLITETKSNKEYIDSILKTIGR